jgi:hypothetical protein
MYHPYFRGKQYELITVRECAGVMAGPQFVPIIEPVKEALGGLERTLKAVCDAAGCAVVIVNPHHWDLAEDGEGIGGLLTGAFADRNEIEAGVLLKEDTSIADVRSFVGRHADARLAFIHAGFTDASALVDALGERARTGRHLFFEPHCGKLYRKHFAGVQRILLRDGFKKRRNADHPKEEIFSDLHVTFEEEGMDGFGDFLIVGDDYSESGGPAYAVAIHLTFIDPDKDNQMYIYHFVSRRKDTPTDPAGKFREALEAMMGKLREPGCKIFQSSAVAEFRELHDRRHFPGLGYVKKLSMKHHIETLADFLGRDDA